jgi:hypothetical protein
MEKNVIIAAYSKKFSDISTQTLGESPLFFSSYAINPKIKKGAVS